MDLPHIIAPEWFVYWERSQKNQFKLLYEHGCVNALCFVEYYQPL